MANNRPRLKAYIYDKRGRLLSTGENSYVKTHPKQARIARQVGERDRIYLHAEIAAIAKCRRLDRAHRIFIERFSRRGAALLARPCAICSRAIDLAGIRVAEYTTENGIKTEEVT